MNRSMKAGALLVAGIFALTGCSGAGETTAGESPAASDSPSPTSTPTPTVGQEQYTPQELEAALAAVKTQLGLTGEVVGEEALAPLLEQAPDMLAGVTITPEQCDVLASTDIAGVVENANMALLLLSQTDSLAVASHPDASVMEKQTEDNARLLDECSEFQMEVAGQAITATTEAVEAQTDAEATQAFRTSIATAEGATETLQISAVSGTTNVQVTMAGAGASGTESAAAVAKAEDAINAVLAELEK